jgi:cytochrome c-type biogenesis protein CcmH
VTRALIAAALLAVGLAAHAIDAETGFPNAEMQARYDRLITELRCLVCQSGSIAESNALLAADLRREVRNMVLAGKTDDEIRRFMTDRYGDFVLYRPPFVPRTWLLWFAPALLLAIGGLVAYRVIAQRSRLVGSDPDEPDGGARP